MLLPYYLRGVLGWGGIKTTDHINVPCHVCGPRNVIQHVDVRVLVSALMPSVMRLH